MGHMSRENRPLQGSEDCFIFIPSAVDFNILLKFEDLKLLNLWTPKRSIFSWHVSFYNQAIQRNFNASFCILEPPSSVSQNMKKCQDPPVK